MRFSLRNRKWYPWAFAALLLGAGALMYIGLPGMPNAEIMLLALGSIGGTIGFLYSQHLQQTHLFKELFTEFNARYDKLNEDLNTILSRPKGCGLSAPQKQKLFDYFNLCAEEYLFFKAGYIDIHVWNAWRLGMKQFCCDAEIASLWREELTTGSYYGFSFDEVELSQAN